MVIINTIFLSGWFQLLLLLAIFGIYSRRVMLRGMKYGYALGWMVGLFFIFSYTALNPPQAFYISAYDYELNLFQIFFASGLGILMGVVIVVVSVMFRDNFVQQSLSSAAISGVFIIAIFMQLIAVPDVRLMVSLFVLAFGIVVLSSYIILKQRNRIMTVNAEAVYPDDSEIIVDQQPRSRLDSIRQRVVRRANRNNVPTNYPNAS